MPRASRKIIDGLIYHVLNRGNEKRLIFADAEDYLEFLDLMARAQERFPLCLLSYCLMPNHFHLVVQVPVAAELAKNMHWLLSTHARRFRSKWEGAGHVWQGRFKSFPVQSDHHLITLLRYVEGNPVRAGMVSSCRDWRWSSLCEREGGVMGRSLLVPLPIELPTDWLNFVDQPLHAAERGAIQLGLQKQVPLGDPIWQRQAADWIEEKEVSRRGRPQTLRE